MKKTKEVRVFAFADYRLFLAAYLENRRTNEKGVQTKLAETLGCQPAYVSKVLSLGAHFSLEQAERAAYFCNLTEEQKDYFIVLVQHVRASTPQLKKYFENQLSKLDKKNKDLQEHMKLEKVTDLETQLRYYSHWSTAATHVLLTIDKYRTRPAISAKLNLPLADVVQIIDFLKLTGMVEETGGELRVGEVGLHLGANSPVIKQHHVNWRLKAMDSVARGAEEDLHYSSVVSISEKDRARFRAELIQWDRKF